LNFWISHGLLGAFLLVLLTIGKVDGLLCLLNALLAELVFGAEFESCFVGGQCLMVLFEEEVAVPLFVVGLSEGGIFLESQLVVFLCSLELHQFDVNLSYITVKFGVFRVSSDGFFVFLQRLWEFASIKK